MDSFGKYQNLDQFGRGGFGIVYRAQDALERTVALKVLNPALVGDPVALQRFQREARTAARLRHPNIVVIYEIGEAQGMHYIAMEYLEGQPLTELVAKYAPPALAQGASILEQIASALDYAHKQSVIHRDVKPSNIFISPSGHATLTDFGLVRVGKSGSLNLTLTLTGLVGTPQYMSPEQADPRDDVPQDGRMDVYALGIITFQMLTARLPFSAETPLGIVRAQLEQAPPPPTQSIPTYLLLSKLLFSKRLPSIPPNGLHPQSNISVCFRLSRRVKRRKPNGWGVSTRSMQIWKS